MQRIPVTRKYRTPFKPFNSNGIWCADQLVEMLWMQAEIIGARALLFDAFLIILLRVPFMSETLHTNI